PAVRVEGTNMIRGRIMSITWTFQLLAVAVTCCCLLPHTAGAQAVTGTILGRATDTSGAVLPGATVTLTHTETGRTRTVVTDSAGEFTAPSLSPGTYTISVELSGFKTVAVSNVRLGVDQKVRVEVHLELGGVA